MKKFIITTLCVLILLPSLNSSQINSQLNNQKKNQTFVDSLNYQNKALQNELIASKKMIELMEKTNNQMNLWYNPYAVIIGSLSLLFTIAAIVFAFIIYRQSKEYKDQIKSLINSYQTALKNLVEDWESKIEKIDEQIEDYKTKMISASDEQKKEFEKEIDKLKKERDNATIPLRPGFLPTQVSGSYNFPGMAGYHFVNCKNCGNTFSVPTYLLGLEKTFISCPNCSSKDLIFH